MLIERVLTWLLGAFSTLISRPPSNDAAEAGWSSYVRNLAVLPRPSHTTTGNGTTPLCLSPDFHIEVVIAHSSRPEDTPSIPDDLLRAIARTQAGLRNGRMRYLSVRGGSEFLQECTTCLGSLEVRLSTDEGAPVLSILEQALMPVEIRPDVESYSLDIPLEGPAVIAAHGALGALRGLTTFENLWYYLPPRRGCEEPEEVQSGLMFAPFAPYSIQDKPAFGWRGLLLDTSRHYFSLEAIRRTLDTMSMVKLNVFQWHITDSNSFPVVLDGFGELAEHGSYSRDEVYTETDVQDIITYAGERGIDVILEIDTPGHTAAIAASHPSFIACAESVPWSKYAHQPPAGQLRFADEKVTEWTARLFEAAGNMVRGSYLSTGGDEINKQCMMEDAATQRSLKASGWSLDQALAHHTNATHSALRTQGKTPIVWQEMALNHGNMSLGNATVVQVWVDHKDAKKVLDKGYRMVHAASDYFYLDCGHGGWIGQAGGGKSWCDPYKTWSRIHSFDPYEGIAQHQRHLVLGGQVSLWTEQTDETNLDSMLWPRAAALADLLWSGRQTDRRPADIRAVLGRMQDVRYRMVDRDVRAVPLQPHWCALRPDTCVEGA
ncbi:hypothetical protein IAU60_006193 [Kwoniella sp. DSM 27419]